MCKTGSVCGHNEDVLHELWECITWFFVSIPRFLSKNAYFVVCCTYYVVVSVEYGVRGQVFDGFL